MAYYPVFLRLRGRRCLVVGGGAVAERKVAGLLAAGAAVTVLSPALTRGLGRLVAAGRIRHLARRYAVGDLAGFDLALAAARDSRVNRTVAREGRRRGVWVNAADDPARCHFILPALLCRGSLLVAVSSQGTSPALAGLVRDEIARWIGADYAALARVAAGARRRWRRRRARPGGAAWRAALGAPWLRRLVAEGRIREARARLVRALA
jgi:siroheme synthase-like protein